jgi:hypothetical protein
MCSFLFFILLVIIIAGAISGLNQAYWEDYEKTYRSKKSNSHEKSKQVIVKKNGQNKRYQINKYGEIYEDN